MPTQTKLPNGQIVSIPDDMTPSEWGEFEALVRSQEKAQNPSMLDQVGHAAGVIARGAIKGVAGLPAMGADAYVTLHNKVFGTNYPTNSMAEIDRRLTQAGFAEPQNMAEKVGEFGWSLLGGGAWNGPTQAVVSKLTGATAPLYNAPVQESARMQNLRAGQEAGYKVLPGEVAQANNGGNVAGRLAESLAGRETLQNTARNQNQNLTNKLAARAAGLPENIPLSRDAVEAAIQDTYANGYEPIKALGKIPATPGYQASLDTIAKNMQGMSRSFPGAAKNDVADLVNAYRVPSMNADDALSAISQLRDEASSAFAKGNSPLGRAAKSIATALEDNIDEYLGSANQPGAQDLLSNFRNARTQLAKQYTVRDALSEATGNLDAAKIGRLFEKKPGYLSGDLKTIGAFAKAAPRLTGSPTTPSGMFTRAEGVGLLGTGLAGLTGAPIAHVFATVPLARAALRQGLMSGLGQQMTMPGLPSNAATLFSPLALGSGLYGMQ